MLILNPYKNVIQKWGNTKILLKGLKLEMIDQTKYLENVKEMELMDWC